MTSLRDDGCNPVIGGSPHGVSNCSNSQCLFTCAYETVLVLNLATLLIACQIVRNSQCLFAVTNAKWMLQLKHQNIA
eukprot:scaffold90809_cov20-Prasinocladus_malaysianus.AAC.3